MQILNVHRNYKLIKITSELDFNKIDMANVIEKFSIGNLVAGTIKNNSFIPVARFAFEPTNIEFEKFINFIINKEERNEQRHLYWVKRH